MALLPFRNPACGPGSVIGVRGFGETRAQEAGEAEWEPATQGLSRRCSLQNLRSVTPAAPLPPLATPPPHTQSHTPAGTPIPQLWEGERTAPRFSGLHTHSEHANTFHRIAMHARYTGIHTYASAQPIFSKVYTSTKPQKIKAHTSSLAWHIASESLESPWPIQKSISGFCPPPHLLPVHTPMCASERSSYHPKGPGVVLSGLPSGRERARAVQPWPQHQDHNLRYSLPALTREQDHALGGSTHAMGEKFDSTKFSPPPPLHPATTPSLPSSTSWLT